MYKFGIQKGKFLEFYKKKFIELGILPAQYDIGGKRLSLEFKGNTVFTGEYILKEISPVFIENSIGSFPRGGVI